MLWAGTIDEGGEGRLLCQVRGVRTVIHTLILILHDIFVECSNSRYYSLWRLGSFHRRMRIPLRYALAARPLLPGGSASGLLTSGVRALSRLAVHTGILEVVVRNHNA